MSPGPKWHLDLSSCFATIDMGQKEEGCCAPFGEAGSPSDTMWPGLRPTSVPNGILIYPAVWPQQTWAKNLGAVPCFLRGSPCNTIWLGLRATSMPSFILIHLTVWPQYTNVTGKQDRQQSDSIGELFYKRSPKKLKIASFIYCVKLLTEK